MRAFCLRREGQAHGNELLECAGSGNGQPGTDAALGHAGVASRNARQGPQTTVQIIGASGRHHQAQALGPSLGRLQRIA